MNRIAQWLLNMDCVFGHHKYILFTWEGDSMDGFNATSYKCMNPMCDKMFNPNGREQ